MKFEVTLLHGEYGEVTTETEVELVAGDILSQYEDIIEQARKNAASRFVDYESFGNDSAYADRLDQVGDEFKPEDVTVLDGKPKLRYHVYGHYSSDEGGTWSDHVFASSRDEAEFQARWIMAENEGSTRGETSSFQGNMEEIEIYDCYPEPITKDEALFELKACHGAMQAFVDKCDSGRARSVNTYTVFKALLETTKVPA